MGESGRVWQVWNFMTQTQPNSLSKIILKPNSTHQALKTDLTQQVGLARIGFDKLTGWLHTPNDNTMSVFWPSDLIIINGLKKCVTLVLSLLHCVLLEWWFLGSNILLTRLFFPIKIKKPFFLYNLEIKEFPTFNLHEIRINQAL